MTPKIAQVVAQTEEAMVRIVVSSKSRLFALLTTLKFKSYLLALF